MTKRLSERNELYAEKKAVQRRKAGHVEGAVRRRCRLQGWRNRLIGC
jgi:hypothetical protein